MVDAEGGLEVVDAEGGLEVVDAEGGYPSASSSFNCI